MQDLLLMPGEVGVQRGTVLLLVPFGCHLGLCCQQSCLGGRLLADSVQCALGL